MFNFKVNKIKEDLLSKNREREIEPYKAELFEENIILTETEFLSLKKFKCAARPINKNVLVVGGPDSGKMWNYVIPNLMQMHSSYVVADPVGILIDETGEMFRRNGYKIRVLNFDDLNLGMSYNPFNYLENDEDALMLADILVERTKGNKGEDFLFINNLEALVLGVFINYIKNCLSLEHQNLNVLYQIIKSGQGNPGYFDRLFKDIKNRFVFDQYQRYRISVGHLEDRVIGSLVHRLDILDSEKIISKSSWDELELTKIGEEKTVLFVIGKFNTDLAFLSSVFYAQILRVLQRQAESINGGRLPVHVRFFLNSQSLIGKPNEFVRFMVTLNEREVSFNLITETKADLRKFCGDYAATLENTCDNILFTGGAEYSFFKEGQCVYRMQGVEPFYSQKFDFYSHENFGLLAAADPRNRFDLKKYLRYLKAKAKKAQDQRGDINAKG